MRAQCHPFRTQRRVTMCLGGFSHDIATYITSAVATKNKDEMKRDRKDLLVSVRKYNFLI